MNKKCPKCRVVYTEFENYCTKCGICLEKVDNKCSENKAARCERRIYKDDDIYCTYCGSMTTYALEREASRNVGKEVG